MPTWQFVQINLTGQYCASLRRRSLSLYPGSSVIKDNRSNWQSQVSLLTLVTLTYLQIGIDLFADWCWMLESMAIKFVFLFSTDVCFNWSSLSHLTENAILISQSYQILFNIGCRFLFNTLFISIELIATWRSSSQRSRMVWCLPRLNTYRFQFFTVLVIFLLGFSYMTLRAIICRVRALVL